MIYSMTGFGKASVQLPTKKITVEIKSLNSKNIDLSVRIPPMYREKELLVRNLITTSLERGKIELSVISETTGEETSTKINAPIVIGYINQLKNILPNADPTELMKMAVRMPDTLKTDREEINENEWLLIENTIKQALENINNFRKQEGDKLYQDFVQRITNIKALAKEIETFEAERIASVKEKLNQALKELECNIDQNRLEQELIFYLEKLDINEEKVRLDNHLNYFVETMNENSSNGRKLGFIAQEIGREINTMGAKSNHAQMQKKVVLMKDELEKIKEQVLNIV